LAHGMLADFVVLSEDIYKVQPNQISQVSITATVISGNVVFGDLP
jgi:predicted amidohydrolase YtcJ